GGGGRGRGLHLSTRLRGGLWVVELRRPGEHGTEPFLAARAGERFRLPGDGALELLTPHAPELRRGGEAPVRLWLATLQLPGALLDYLERHGFPIRYSYVRERWPNGYYQTVYPTEPGSAEK